MRREAWEQIGAYDATVPHAADMLLWFQTARNWDIGRVNGPKQAQYRVHGENMHLTMFAGMMRDLHKQRAVFSIVFPDRDSDTDAAKMFREARTAMAVRALRLAAVAERSRRERARRRVPAVRRRDGAGRAVLGRRGCQASGRSHRVGAVDVRPEGQDPPGVASMATVRDVTADEGQLGQDVRRGFLWSFLSNTSLRLGTFVTGIVLARVLAPEEFGVYAIALTVQTILMTMSELGLAADLVRHGDVERRGPTIATLSLVSSTLITLVMCVAAYPIASALGSESAAPIIQVMSVTVLLAGIGVVPYAVLQRGLRQRALFANDVVSFVVSTGLTLALALAGVGAMSLAIGRVAAQCIATYLQFRWSKQRLRFGWDPQVARTGLRFGFPLACAGLLAWTLMGMDNILVAHAAGATMLGLYVLAFNISSWPSSVIGTAVRAVAMPAFARRAQSLGEPDTASLRSATALAWAAALPIGVVLAVLARPTITVVYGPRWSAAAVALGWLGLFGATRVVFDLWVAYLTASGRATLLLWTQVVWLVTLAPAMVLAIRHSGLEGAAWAHLVVALVVMLPVYLWALHRAGVPVRSLLVPLLVPAAAVAPAAVVGRLVVASVDGPWLQLVAGTAATLVVYALVLWPWARRQPMVTQLIRDRRARVGAALPS